MILFSTLNDFNVLLLFLYLGLASGLLFFVARKVFSISKNKFANFLAFEIENFSKKRIEKRNLRRQKKLEKKDFLTKKRQVKLEKKLERQKQKNAQKNKINKTKKQKPERKIEKKPRETSSKNQASNKRQKNLVSNPKNAVVECFEKAEENKNLLSALKKIFDVITSVLEVVLFVAVCLFSFFKNLELNYGEVTFFYILIWGLGFLLGKYVCNLVAKYLFCFYNYLRNKKNG